MKLALIGEAFGQEEDVYKLPFIGPAGQELDRLLEDAGINRKHCLVTNVFNFRPPGNDILALCRTKTTGTNLPGYPSIAQGKYIQAEYAPEIERLYNELRAAQPNLCVLFGNTASWALLGNTGVGKIRGAVSASPYIPGLKCLPTYHPAAVLRQYELRHVTVLDLIKAKHEAEYPEIRRIDREIWLDPTLEDIESFFQSYVAQAKELSFDIETRGTQITCIGFAPTVDRAIVIPFVDDRKSSGSYWPDVETECKAWHQARRYLASPAVKVAQNGIYDMSHLWYTYGIPVFNFAEDTMIRHHSMQPELTKGLAFLGSVYTDNPAWKTERSRGKHSIKRDD